MRKKKRRCEDSNESKFVTACKGNLIYFFFTRNLIYFNGDKSAKKWI
jgi:hypothetical protein